MFPIIFVTVKTRRHETHTNREMIEPGINFEVAYWFWVFTLDKFQNIDLNLEIRHHAVSLVLSKSLFGLA